MNTDVYSLIYDIIAYSEPQEAIDKLSTLVANLNLPPEQVEDLQGKLYDWVAFYRPIDALEEIYQAINGGQI